jgi:hypothetical protein
VTAVGFGVCDADAAGSSTSAVMTSASSADRRFPGLGRSFLVARCSGNPPYAPVADSIRSKGELVIKVP